jgi:putative ABC transport system ATP-binding protein
MKIASFKNITKSYNGEARVDALRDVKLDISAGEFISVMGPSGCGKSTLLNILGLLDSPTEGSYLFLGEEMATINERKRAHFRKSNIGFIFQNFNLVDELNIYENVELPLVYLKVPPAERKTRVNEVLEKMDMKSQRKKFPHQLSGGQQQRVAVARALVIKPKIVLADEPTGNLDSDNGHHVMQLLTDINREGTAVVMVTHAKEFALYAQRIIKILDGRIIYDGSREGTDV